MKNKPALLELAAFLINADLGVEHLAVLAAVAGGVTTYHEVSHLTNIKAPTLRRYVRRLSESGLVLAEHPGGAKEARFVLGREGVAMMSRLSEIAGGAAV